MRASSLKIALIGVLIVALSGNGFACLSLNKEHSLSGSENLQETEERTAAGFQLSTEGRYEEAIAELDQAILLNPKYAEAWYERGRAYAYLENYKRAIKDYDRATTLYPQYVLAFYHRAAAYIALGKDELAEDDIARLVERVGFDRDFLEGEFEEIRKQIVARSDAS